MYIDTIIKKWETKYPKEIYLDQHTRILPSICRRLLAGTIYRKKYMLYSTKKLFKLFFVIKFCGVFIRNVYMQSTSTPEVLVEIVYLIHLDGRSTANFNSTNCYLPRTYICISRTTRAT